VSPSVCDSSRFTEWMFMKFDTENFHSLVTYSSCSKNLVTYRETKMQVCTYLMCKSLKIYRKEKKKLQRKCKHTYLIH